MAASDYVSETPEFTLALKGASTDEKQTLTPRPRTVAAAPQAGYKAQRSAALAEWQTSAG